jgi:hypothetical protein
VFEGQRILCNQEHAVNTKKTTSHANESSQFSMDRRQCRRARAICSSHIDDNRGCSIPDCVPTREYPSCQTVEQRVYRSPGDFQSDSRPATGPLEEGVEEVHVKSSADYG